MTRQQMVDLVVFEIAGTRYGADLGHVRRIDSDAEQEDVSTNVGELLGRPLIGHRGLVFATLSGPVQRLSVDTIMGVRRVSVSDLRRVPSAIEGTPFAMGFWLDGDEVVVLIDLLAMASFALSERERGDVN